MITRSDLVRGTASLLLIAGAAIACCPASLAGPVDMDGSLRTDVEASETELPALANLVATVAVFGEAWRTTGRMTLADGEFVAFDVTDDRSFGPFRLRSICVFDPDIGFSYLASTARFTLADVEMGSYVFLSRDPSLSYGQLTGRRTEGDLVLSGTVRTGLCPFEFRSALVAGQWYVPSCDLFMDVRSSLTSAVGFDFLRITGRFPRLPFLSNDVVETELRLTLQFDTDRKTFMPSLQMRAGQINACMSPSLEVVVGPSSFELDGVKLYGWTVECAVSDAVEALLATSLDPARNRELTGEADYWEMWKLRGRVEGCCGSDLLWELATYFEDAGGSLFDWGATSVSVDAPLGERLTIRVAARFAAGSPHWKLTAGGEIRF